MEQVINLISDTVTRPTPAMLDAMMKAKVGDDVFGEDPSINALEEKLAAMFNHQAAVFCPSGTMTNQIAIKTHTRPLDEVICNQLSHIYTSEVGGYSFNSGVAINLLPGSDGKIRLADLKKAKKPDRDWLPNSRLVVIENTCNIGGGTIYTLPEMEALSAYCRKMNLKCHLDGARLFNALVETGDNPAAVGSLFDSISICLSKGLGAPVGSVLIGSANFIRQARKVRKALGGGMRQAGYLAAAGIYALDHHIDRLKEDNDHAKLLGEALLTCSWVKTVKPVESNIVFFDLRDDLQSDLVISKLREKKVLCSPFSPNTLRFATHLEITPPMIQRVIQIVQNLIL